LAWGADGWGVPGDESTETAKRLENCGFYSIFARNGSLIFF
jgi:hypothetical protein